MVEIISVDKFAKQCSDISKSDRWLLVAFTGKQGEGKSNLSDKFLDKVAKFNETSYTLNGNMTYSRKELKTWIDGDKDGKNQKPERSCILADELISMFFRRNWFDSEQIDGIELLNKCRDRHLIVAGNIPKFLLLDSAIYSIIAFWVHIHERGRAWVFMPDDNPFIADEWHVNENAKIWAKNKNPYLCPNFVCEIHFEDFTPERKEEYYKIRNEKRKKTEGQRAKEDKYRIIKEQRNQAIKLIFQYKPDMTNKAVSDIVDISEEAVRLIRNDAI